MTISPSCYPEGLPHLKAGRWSDVVAAIEADGGPITPHPDAETLRRRAQLNGRSQPTTDLLTAVAMPSMDLDEAPPTPLPARPYEDVHRAVVLTEVLEPAPPSRRGWLARALRRFA